ncbi:serine-rich coiled-coil domain-containing protein 2-like isoform X1 [Lates japonicus]|uniref:Serine-rich coiled-coil domain-containing protein 2-like isoform X1 n=1 Tax=Lates japonicus TaxID=270547 RepID=A0AAD3N0E5_LATJO|nr:serine-rich coiled-coil domain-containing protein 2-like isoform X1 [Lates japonicus]
MSAPPLVDPPAMPTMVSRLPKFGLRPTSATAPSGAQMGPTANTGTFTSTAVTSTRLTNGFYHHPGPAGVNGSLTAPPSSVKQNGFIRVPTSFTMKLRKENGTMEDGGVEEEGELRRGKDRNVGQNRSGNNIHQYYSQRPHGSPVVSQRDAKKTTTSSAGKGRGFGQPVSSTSMPLPQSSPRTLPGSKSGSHGSKPSQTASGLTNGTKQTLNGLPGSKPQSGTNEKQQPVAHTPVTALGPLRPSNSLRATGFAHVASPRVQKEEVELEGSVQKKEFQGRVVSIPSLLPPSALKKPLLTGLGPPGKPSGISYKLSRPSLIKQSRPLRVTPTTVSSGDPEVNQGLTGRRNSVEILSTTENSPG